MNRRAKCIFVFLFMVSVRTTHATSLSFVNVAGSSVSATLPTTTTTSSATICAWIYLRTTGAFRGIALSRATGALQGILENNPGTQIISAWDGSAAETTFNSGLFPALNKWYFIAAAFQGNGTNTYMIDQFGVVQSTFLAINHGSRNITGLWYIGDDIAAVSRNLNGNICDVRVFSRTLSFNEILTLAAQPFYPLTDGLVAWWKCDNGDIGSQLGVAGTAINDYSSQKINMAFTSPVVSTVAWVGNTPSGYRRRR